MFQADVFFHIIYLFESNDNSNFCNILVAKYKSMAHGH